MGQYTIGGHRGYFYFISKDGRNLNAEQVVALLNGERSHCSPFRRDVVECG